MSTMPFAPRTPYRAVAVASFRMEKVAMSSTSTRSMLRSTPSTSTSGVEFAPKVFTPRIQNSALSPGSPERCIATTPASLPARPVDSWPIGACSCSCVTVEMEPMTEAFFWAP